MYYGQGSQPFSSYGPEQLLASADYGLVQTSAPAAEPVLLPEARLWCRVETDDDDPLLQELIAACRQRCERVSGRRLVTQTWELTLDRFPAWWSCGRPHPLFAGDTILLPGPPLASVSSVKYLDAATGVLTTLAGTEYQVDTKREPGRIRPAWNKVWPTPRLQEAAVTITYVAGYGSTGASVPADIRRALKHAVAYCYDRRDEADEACLDGLFRAFNYGGL